MQRKEEYLGLESLIEQAIQDACAKGLSYAGQTGNAVRKVQKVKPNLSPFEAVRLVDLYRAEN
jgi:hypothetical protein